MTFEEYCAENCLTILTREQVESVCLSIHSHMADADSIAIDDSDTATLAIKRGNLEHYAGLDPSLVGDRALDLKTREFTAWRFRKSPDCNLTRVLDLAVRASRDPLAELAAETLRHALRELAAFAGVSLHLSNDADDTPCLLASHPTEGTKTLASLPQIDY